MDKIYIDRMKNNLNEKEVVLQFLNRELFLNIDVGASTGYLSKLMYESMQDSKVIALEPDKSTFEQLTTSVKNIEQICPVNMSFDEQFINTINEPANIIFSSVIHEIYSYNKIFHKGSSINDRVTYFRNWLGNVLSKVHPQTRIIIRDGIRPYNDKRYIKYIPLNIEIFNLAQDFLLLFKSWNPFIQQDISVENNMIIAPAWIVFEMLFTITWGRNSLQRESQEHFTILSNMDYQDMLNESGFETIYSQCFVQEGYIQYFEKLGSIFTMNDFPLPFPFTTQILVADKM